MSSLFIDTSAFLALLDADDHYHQRAKAAWTRILQGDSLLTTSNYVLVETLALLQNRLGQEAVRLFQEDVVPLLAVQWVGEPIHAAAVSALLTAGRRRLSLVDCASFEVMRHAGVKKAFTFDRHFSEQGFSCVPGA